MILFPPAKINLGLKVLNKRDDGYHNLETIMYQIPLCDILEINKTDQFFLKTTGIEILGNQKDNLCYRAYHLLREKYQIGAVGIHLHKIIPMGAGLGGGSADGTYTLMILNELFELNLSTNDLRRFALELGSDCPLFVESTSQLAKGRGEILSPIAVSLSKKYIYIINIGIHVSTKEAFQNIIFSDDNSEILTKIVQLPIENWKNNLKNNFENSVFKVHPILAELKDNLYREGAIYASMTGSGSTIFGVFESKPLVKLDSKFKKVVEKILYID